VTAVTGALKIHYSGCSADSRNRAAGAADRDESHGSVSQRPFSMRYLLSLEVEMPASGISEIGDWFYWVGPVSHAFFK
jgi:hypothetical protein